MKPNKKMMGMISPIFLVLTKLEPTNSPIWLIDFSAPRLKKIIPSITSNDPNTNCNNKPLLIGMINKPFNKTNNKTGKTATSDSWDFSCRFSFNVFKNIFLRSFNTHLLPISYLFQSIL